MRVLPALLALLVLLPGASASAQSDAEIAQIYKACEALAQSEAPEAAVCFEGLGRRWPQWERADTALYNAAVLAHPNVDLALTAAERLVKKYPASEHIPASLDLIAALRDGRGEIDAAMNARWELARRFPEYGRSRGALRTLVSWYVLQGDQRQLERASELYVKLYPRDEDAPRVAAAPALALARTQCRRARKPLTDWLGRWKGGSPLWEEVSLALGRCLLELGEEDGVKQFALVARAAGTRQTEAAFEALEPRFAALRKLKVGGKDERALKESLTARVKASTYLATAYADLASSPTQAADGEVRWRLAATVRTGQVYEELAAEIRAAPLPETLNEPEVRDVYVATLEDVLQPLEAKAVQAFESVVTKAGELDIYDEHVRAAREGLTRLRPAQWPAARAGKGPAIDGSLSGGGTAKEGATDARIRGRVEAARAALDAGRPADALYLLDPWIEDGDALNLRGVAYYRRGELGLALLSFAWATRVQPGHAVAARNRAALRAWLGIARGP